MLSAMLLAGCATRRTGNETARLDVALNSAQRANADAQADAAAIRTGLSRADAKAVVILEWLRQHPRSEVLP